MNFKTDISVWQNFSEGFVERIRHYKIMGISIMEMMCDLMKNGQVENIFEPNFFVTKLQLFVDYPLIDGRDGECEVSRFIHEILLMIAKAYESRCALDDGSTLFDFNNLRYKFTAFWKEDESKYEAQIYVETKDKSEGACA